MSCKKEGGGRRAIGDLKVASTEAGIKLSWRAVGGGRRQQVRNLGDAQSKSQKLELPG